MLCLVIDSKLLLLHLLLFHHMSWRGAMASLACCNAKGREAARTGATSTSTRNKHENGHSRIRGFSSEDFRHRDNSSRGGVTDRRSRHYDDDDSYRDRSRDDGDKDRRPPKRPKQKRAWPPPFDTDGALYVFDSRSGFFYEAESNFYYDPKSRYYYSIEKAAYFQYCPEQEPPFRRVPSRSQQHGEIDTSTAVEAATGAAAAGSKMKIAISLKTKSSGGGGTVSVNSSNMDTGAMNPAKQTSPTESRGIKQSKAAYDADIVKWNQARSINAHNSKASDSPDTEATNISAPKTTKSGQPVCLLCRRKFPNIEALQKHEQSSALHKQNLAKKDKDAAETSKSASRPDNPSVEYRDRAKDRRSMYGADVSGAVPSVASSECSPGAIISSASADFGPNLERARAVATTATVRPSDAFGDSNLGSQMLQKIGWKKGSSLGRKKSLETRDNSDGTSSDRPEGSDANIQMLKEWEKIESAAAAPRTCAASSSFRSAREEGTSSRRAGIGNNKGERYM